MPTPDIQKRQKNRTASGVIRGWSAQLDPVKAGYPVVLFIRVEVDLPINREAFADTVANLPGVQECHLTSGRWNCCLKLRAASVDQADKLIAEEIAPLKGVMGMQVDAVTRTRKETLYLPGSDPRP